MNNGPGGLARVRGTGACPRLGSDSSAKLRCQVRLSPAGEKVGAPDENWPGQQAHPRMQRPGARNGELAS